MKQAKILLQCQLKHDKRKLNFFLSAMLYLFFTSQAQAQNTFNFDGQLSGVVNWSPENDAYGFLNGRYIPELNYDWKLDSIHSLYFEASANMYGSVFAYKGDSLISEGNIQPYRIYARFTGNRYEARVGLQKIDFGSAMILRPLQWFNEIDPRDPLQLTNGVYAALGRYYFLNNANIWVWGLIGNVNTRGFDAVKPNPEIPEFGGRFQYPVPKGELALSYHHRYADVSEFPQFATLDAIPENRIGLDGKWDVGVGLWFESAYIKKQQNVGELTNQTLFTLGSDYTFGIGSGLNVVFEHMVLGYDESNIGFATHYNTSAVSISYPIGFFDHLSFFTTYSWEFRAASYFLNYQHDFRKITGYFMAYFTPKTSSSFVYNSNDFVNSFTGPGLRVMLVFNH